MNPAQAFSFDLSYCGPPPVSSDIWGRWNFDLALLAAIVVFAVAGALALRQSGRGERLAFGSAMALILVAFVSPLCALTVALFSARVAHHVLLVAIIAPLLAIAFSRFATRFGVGNFLMPLFILHTAVFWLWHAPDAYVLALSNPTVYWLMQLTLLGSATLMWSAVFESNARGLVLSVLLGTTLQMGMLGALLVFATDPLYLPHMTTTQSFGLDPISDQQLSGILMWVPASLPYLAVALWQVFSWLGTPMTASRR